MEIIDTHVHVWNLRRAAYDWLTTAPSVLHRTYSLAELEPQRLAAQVRQGVLVQAANNTADTTWMLEVAASSDWITGVVGWLPLQDPSLTHRLLTETYLLNPYFKGVRHLIHNEADPAWLLQPAVLDSLRLVAEHGLSYDVVGIEPAHLHTALQVVERVPALRLVLDHLNQPPIRQRERFGRWGELVSEFSAHPNCYAKISGLGTAANCGTGWTEDDLAPYIEFALAQFGPERCFCGGDWPVALLAGTYTRTWQAYRRLLSARLDEETQRRVLSYNACQFYQLPIL